MASHFTGDRPGVAYAFNSATFLENFTSTSFSKQVLASVSTLMVDTKQIITKINDMQGLIKDKDWPNKMVNTLINS